MGVDGITAKESVKTMNNRYKNRIIGALFLLSILTACVASVFIGRNLSADTTTIWEYSLRDLSHGWQYQTDAGRQDIPELPARVKSRDITDKEASCLTLYYRLPEDLPKTPCLEFVSQQTSVEVFIDDQTIYTYGVYNNVPVGNLLGNARNVIPLPSDAGGKEIAIRLASPYSTNTYRLGMITLGNRSEILYRFVCSNIDLAAFCIMSFFFCIMILFVVIFFKIKKVELGGLSFVSFAFLSTAWIMTDSSILQLVTSRFALVYFISHMTFMLLPVSLMMLLRQTISRGKKWCNALCMMYLLGFFLRVGLFFGGVANLEKTLLITHIMFGIGAIAGCILLAREWRLQRDKTSLVFLIGFIALACCLAISLLVFFLAIEPNYSIYFRIMLSIMMVAMMYRIISQIQAMATEGIKAQVYHEMAYLDALTNLSNRLAFEDQMRTIQEKPECHTLTLVMFDINRLKYVNDHYGHGAGDQLIKCAADCIQQKFAPIGKCYRIGGDEFAVILKDFSEQSLEKVLDEFQEMTKNAESGNPEGLSVSAGYADGPAEGDNFAYHLFNKADQQMYRHKRKMYQQNLQKHIDTRAE